MIAAVPSRSKLCADFARADSALPLETEEVH